MPVHHVYDEARKPPRLRRGCDYHLSRFLAYLSSIERSPNTVKAYAHDLRDWFDFLAGRERDWQAATLEDVAAFVAWLRRPPAGLTVSTNAHNSSGTS